MPEKMCKKKHLTSFQLIILGFAGVILLGSHFMRHFLQPLRQYALQDL